jgi:hypothetical protein
MVLNYLLVNPESASSTDPFGLVGEVCVHVIPFNKLFDVIETIIRGGKLLTPTVFACFCEAIPKLKLVVERYSRVVVVSLDQGHRYSLEVIPDEDHPVRSHRCVLSILRLKQIEPPSGIFFLKRLHPSLWTLCFLGLHLHQGGASFPTDTLVV